MDKTKKLAWLKNHLTLGPNAWQGAAFSLLVCTAILFLGMFFGGGIHSFINGAYNFVFALLIGVLSFLLGSLLVNLLDLVQKLQQPYRWILLGSLVLLFNLMIASVHLIINAIAVVIYFVVVVSLLGAGIRAWTTAKKENRPRKIPAVFGITGGLGLCLLLIWFAWPGQPYAIPGPVNNHQATEPVTELEHPAEAGPYKVLELTYGSGTDKRRSEYGRDVDITTYSVSVSTMIGKPMAPVLWLRDTYWGFGLDEVPLNARVWYPAEDGQFPLVLMVHGNHIMDDFSDPGYDYLGELLASRGFIAVSIDQNFLNAGGFIEAILGGLSNENDARAYLLLNHLSLWHSWNEKEGHPFENMIDTNNIGLIGHSRGGEAAAIAAAFNHLPFHPGNSDISFDFGYNLQSVVAIAPSDGQFQPRKQKTELNDINYLVLQGSSDSDVRSFQGARQYDRVSFTENSNHFKASVYIHGANHGQFNTRWGRIDQTFSRLFLDRSNIMPEDLQKLTAKVFISSFLEDTLQGRHDYRQLFTDPLLRQNWLPDSLCHIQHRDSSTKIIADFHEDMDLTTLAVNQGKAFGENFLSWREESPGLGYGQLRDRTSLYLSWSTEGDEEAIYAMMLPEDLAEEVRATTLTFCVANVSENRNPVDFIVILRDRNGEEAELPLNHVAALPPPPQYRMFKKPLGVEFLSEPIFSTYKFLLSDFSETNSALNPQAVTEIRFSFTNSSGSIYLDDVGLCRTP